MDDEELARLLSGKNRPSVLAREEAARRAIAEAEGPHRTWLYGMGSVAAFAAAIGLMVLTLRGEPEPELAARGGEVPTLSLSCGDEGAACRPGAMLTFEVHAAHDFPFFAAFARRDDGIFLWYVPVPGGRSVALAGKAPLLATAIRIGPEHTPGEHQVFGVFSRRALSREEIVMALGDELQGSADVHVAVKPLQVRDAP